MLRLEIIRLEVERGQILELLVVLTQKTLRVKPSYVDTLHYLNK